MSPIDIFAEPSAGAMTLEDLLGMVRDLLTAGLPDSFWVVAEIAQLKMSPKGYCNLDLVQKSGATLIAQARAVAWADTCRTVFARFERESGQSLRPGMSILMRASVTFHVQFGFTLRIHDIDPTYTLGEMARKRKEVIDRLDKEGLLDKNKRLPFPLAPLRIAVISSATAAGYEDFVHQLDNNIYGYRFKHELYPSLMQGVSARSEVVFALAKAARRCTDFDLLVIIRGGGSLVDLSCFDEYEIAAAIGGFPLPVITGIGHERDETVADMAAHSRAKTPTAAAEQVIAAVRAFDQRIEEVRARILVSTGRLLSETRQNLDRAATALSRQAVETCVRERSRLLAASHDIDAAVRRNLERRGHRLQTLETTLRLLDPINILRRGYSITYANGQLIRSTSQVTSGMRLETVLAEGRLTSIVSDELQPPAEPGVAAKSNGVKRPAKPATPDSALRLDI